MKCQSLIFILIVLSAHRSVGQGIQQSKQIVCKTNYLLFLPKGYNENPKKKWPLILFLHGASKRGNNINKVKSDGLPQIVDEQKDFPFIVVSPQCPEAQWWSNPMLNIILDEVISQNRVDINKMYLTGLSMGGFGTWQYASEYPDKFAAIAPICGGGDPYNACILKNIPIWVFHGQKDEIVPVEKSDLMVKAIKDVGGNVKYTVYPDADHDSWTETYNNPELYTWFLSHEKKELMTAKVDSNLFSEYVGSYKDEKGMSVIIKKMDEKLYGMLPNTLWEELLPINDLKFIMKNKNAEFTLVRENNIVISVNVDQCKSHTNYKKILITK